MYVERAEFCWGGRSRRERGEKEGKEMRCTWRVWGKIHRGSEGAIGGSGCIASQEDARW